MREHEYTVELPHAPARLWALFQRYDLWKEFAPAVLDVTILEPGDAAGNGLVRRVTYPLPFGRRGVSDERVDPSVHQPRERGVDARCRRVARPPSRVPLRSRRSGRLTPAQPAA